MGPISIAMDELRDLVSANRMTREAYQELERELALLDQGFPREAEGWAIEAIKAGLFYQEKGSVEAVLDALGRSEGKPTWRYAFSDRLVLIDAFQTDRFWHRRLSDAAGKPWREAREVLQEIAAEERISNNPVLRRGGGLADLFVAGSTSRNHFREFRAQLRLLRSAAAYRAAGDIPALEDPYGDKILSSSTGARLKIWSVGADGIDDGGTGEWYRWKGKDLVLELDR
jgi:hypothetical protein